MGDARQGHDRGGQFDLRPCYPKDDPVDPEGDE